MTDIVVGGLSFIVIKNLTSTLRRVESGGGSNKIKSCSSSSYNNGKDRDFVNREPGNHFMNLWRFRSVL